MNKWVIQLNQEPLVFGSIEDGEFFWQPAVVDAIGFYDRQSAEAFWGLLVFRGVAFPDPQISIAAYRRWTAATAAESTEEVPQ